ncbi:Terminase-like family protein [compost metagenome]
MKLVHASRSKKARAEPVAALYEQGRVVHCEAFPALEEEMMALGSEAAGAKSPDRADALVWALTHLLLAGKTQPRLRAL